MVVRSKTSEADSLFARGFKAARIAAGLTQEQVMTEMTERGFGFYAATVYKVENELRRVTVAEALALAEIVGAPVEVLASTSDGGVNHRAVVVALGRQWVEAVRELMAHAAVVEGIESYVIEAAYTARDAGLHIDEFESLINQQLGGMTYRQAQDELAHLPSELLAALHIGRDELPRSTDDGPASVD